MQVSQANNVKVYNLSSGKSLPEWISDRKKRLLLKQDVELRRRIELIQDFNMPTASNCVQVTPDGQYVLSTGVYKPRLKCFDVNQLSQKFDRCFDSECLKFEVLSDDFSKLILLHSDRYVEFHAQYGRYYRTRMPRYGRDLAYHRPSCDLYLVGDGADVFRLNLEQGRYLEPYNAECNGINVCEVNPEHQMLSVGTEDGTIVCFDPRSRTKIGTLSIISQENLPNSVTSLSFKNGLEVGVGTSGGEVFIYDIRSNKPRLTKSHAYELPIKSISFHQLSGNVISADTKIIKLWDNQTGENFTSIEPGIGINDVCTYQDSGLIFLANEASKNSVYYIPSLGQAPKWCSFLDNITEELEESDEVVLYDDYKFVTNQDLENLGLSHLRGSNVLRAYMHGYFIDMRLYHKAKSIVEPFAYVEYRKNRIREKLEEERASRIKLSKMPKINRVIAERLLDEKQSMKNQGEIQDEGIANPLGDDRFAAMFLNKDFQVDMESEEYRLLHPVMSKQEKERRRRRDEEFSEDEVDAADNIESEIEVPAKRQNNTAETREFNEPSEVSVKKKKKIKKVKLVELEDSINSKSSKKQKSKALGDLLNETSEENVIQSSGTALGSRELTFKIPKKKIDTKKEEQNKAHRMERKLLRRSTGDLLTVEKKPPVFWRGKKVK